MADAFADLSPAPWTMWPCPCGDPICKQYFVSVTHSDGRVSRADAGLIVAARALLVAAMARVSAGHNDTCAAELSPTRYPCSCGHDALVDAIDQAGGRR